MSEDLKLLIGGISFWCRGTKSRWHARAVWNVVSAHYFVTADHTGDCNVHWSQPRVLGFDNSIPIAIKAMCWILISIYMGNEFVCTDDHGRCDWETVTRKKFGYPVKCPTILSARWRELKEDYAIKMSLTTFPMQEQIFKESSHISNWSWQASTIALSHTSRILCFRCSKVNALFIQIGNYTFFKLVQ